MELIKYAFFGRGSLHWRGKFEFWLFPPLPNFQMSLTDVVFAICLTRSADHYSPSSGKFFIIEFKQQIGVSFSLKIVHY